MLEQEQSEDYSYYVIHNYHSNFAAVSCIKAIAHKLTKKGDEYQQAFSNSDAYRAVVYRGIAQVVAIALLIAIVVIELPFIAERFANLGNIAQAADINDSSVVQELTDDVGKGASGYLGISTLFGFISLVAVIVSTVKYSGLAKRADVVFDKPSRVLLANVISCLIAPAVINYLLTHIDVIAFNVVHLVVGVLVVIACLLAAFYLFGGALSGAAADRAYNNSAEGKRANLNKQLDKAKRAERYHGKAAATSAMGNYHKQVAKDYARERDRIQDKLNRL